MSDLEERLVRAAEAALDDLRPELERDPANVRGLTVELTIGPAGGSLGGRRSAVRC